MIVMMNLFYFHHGREEFLLPIVTVIVQINVTNCNLQESSHKESVTKLKYHIVVLKSSYRQLFQSEIG